MVEQRHHRGVAEGTLDLGGAFGPIEAQLATQVLYKGRLMLACASGHPLALLDHVSIAALTKETLALLTPDYGTRRTLERYFGERSIELLLPPTAARSSAEIAFASIPRERFA